MLPGKWLMLPPLTAHWPHLLCPLPCSVVPVCLTSKNLGLSSVTEKLSIVTPLNCFPVFPLLPSAGNLIRDKLATPYLLISLFCVLRHYFFTQNDLTTIIQFTNFPFNIETLGFIPYTSFEISIISFVF